MIEEKTMTVKIKYAFPLDKKYTPEEVFKMVRDGVMTQQEFSIWARNFEMDAWRDGASEGFQK
jgi:hypothetical protein